MTPDSDREEEVRRLSVPPELGGGRLDRILVALLGGVSRARVQELIRDGGVRVDGDTVQRPATELAAEAMLELRAVPRSRERRGGPTEEKLVLVFEDEHLAVVEKPAGVVTHPSTIVRGGTLAEQAALRWTDLPSVQGEGRPGIVHRLDADTSGLIVLAKREPAALELVRAFRDREVEKTYKAIVFGEPRFDSDWIEAPLGRSKRRHDRMSVVEDGEGREAQTFYETTERFRGFAFLTCRPRTGRTHQIRVHLASIDHPLLGDRVYHGRRGLSFRAPADAPPFGRHALHASALRFRHPVTGAKLIFESPLPADMQTWLDWLRANRA